MTGVREGSTLAYKLEVMQAHERGEDIQSFSNGMIIPKWLDVKHPRWNWEIMLYRVKLKDKVKTKPQVFWMNVYGLVPGPGRYTSEQTALEHRVSGGGQTFLCTEVISE